MEMNEMLSLAEQTEERILSAGADSCSVAIENNIGGEIEFRDGRTETLKSSETGALSISIYKDGKFSSHSTSGLKSEELEQFILNGVEMTDYLNIDKFRKLPDPSLYGSVKNIDLNLKDLQNEHPDEKKSILKLKFLEEEIMKSGNDLISVTTGFSNNCHRSVLLNSNGFKGARESTYFSIGAEITAKDGPDKLIEDFYFASSRHLEKLPSLEAIAENAVKNTIRKKGQKKIESKEYETVIENRIIGTILSTLLSPLSGNLIHQKKSYLDDKIGKKIASDSLNIIDNPFIKGGLGSKLFDSEGISSKKRNIVESGILRSFFIDSYYGRKLGMAPTSGSYSNLIIPPGEKTLKQMIGDIDDGIFITGFIGGNFNSTTGDFSFGITGIKIEQGKSVSAVNEMNISGNAVELWNRFIEASDDSYLFSRIISPSIRFSALRFSGL